MRAVMNEWPCKLWRLNPLPCAVQEMLHAEQKELENFLTHIYRAIASAAPLKDKVRGQVSVH